MPQLLNKSAQTAEQGQGRRPAHQSAYEKLRDRILFGDLLPGQAVTIQGLVANLGAGMTPVREAIRRLTSEGALKMQGNRRVIVPEISLDCIEQLDFMRQSIEPNLAGRAVEHMTKETLNELNSFDDKLNTAIDQGDIHGYLQQNYNFHTTIYTCAKAPILSATVDRLWLQFGPALRVVCGRYGTLNLPDKHVEMLDAFVRRDRKAVEMAMAEDVRQGTNQIREALAASSLT